MSQLATLLRQGFWALDRCKGAPIAKHLRDVEQLFGDYGHMQATSAERLAKLLRHATATTAFYAPLQGSVRLSDFPVVEKRLIRERYDEFFSSAFQRDQLILKQTSGSHSTPLDCYHTPEKDLRVKAEVLFFNRWLQYDVGESFAYVKVDNTTTPLNRFLQNQTAIEPLHLTAEKLEEIRLLLHRRKPRFIIGYPTALAALAKHCQSKSDDHSSYSLRGIITIAEPLSDALRTLLHNVFGCPVLGRYAASEFGVLAHECLNGKRYHLNAASHVIELLALDSDKPAAPGELGRVVITDLFSQAMPLIRYDIGDLAITPDNACECGLPGASFSRLEGRDLDMIYTSTGEQVLPLGLQDEIETIARDIHQYQFVQTGRKNYLMRIMSAKTLAAEAALVQHLKWVLGESASIELVYVDEIPPLASGKRSSVINEWRKEMSQH